MRRRFWLAAGLLLAAIPAAGFQQRQKRDPCTSYFVIGKRPRGLSGFQAFGLYRIRDGARKGQVAGWVMTDIEKPDESGIALREISLKGRRLKFNTEPRRGLVFRFDGRFLKDGVIKRYTGQRIPVAEGTVTRLTNGRKTAEGKMRFYCEDGAG